MFRCAKQWNIGSIKCFKTFHCLWLHFDIYTLIFIGLWYLYFENVIYYAFAAYNKISKRIIIINIRDIITIEMSYEIHSHSLISNQHWVHTFYHWNGKNGLFLRFQSLPLLLVSPKTYCHQNPWCTKQFIWLNRLQGDTELK